MNRKQLAEHLIRTFQRHVIAHGEIENNEEGRNRILSICQEEIDSLLRVGALSFPFRIVAIDAASRGRMTFDLII